MHCSVHIYKYSQDNRRRKLRKLCKEGHLKLTQRTKTHFHYEIISMEEYRKRK